MNEVDRCMTGHPEHSSSLTVEALRRLIDKGSALPPQLPSERTLNQLQQLVSECGRLEDEAKRLRQTKHTLDVVDDLLEDARRVTVVIPSLQALKQSTAQARDWINRVDDIIAPYHPPTYVGVLEKLISHAHSLPVELEQVATLDTLVASAKVWLDDASRTFLSKHSVYSLYEVLSPRVEIYPAHLQAKRRKQRPGDAHSIHGKNVVREIPDGELPNAAAIKNSFKEAYQREISAMIALRDMNAFKATAADTSSDHERRPCGNKSESSSPGSIKYCICARPKTADMVQCQLCLDFFHTTCVTIPKSVGQPKNSKVMQPDYKFFCHLCMRSRRPTLKVVSDLISLLEDLPVRIAEGEALDSLAERARVWQRRALSRLETREMACAMDKLSVVSQQRVEQAARDKTERIINSELLKAASSNLRQSDYGNASQYSRQPPVDQSYIQQGHRGYPPPLRQSSPYLQNLYPPSLGSMQIPPHLPATIQYAHGFVNAGMGNQYQQHEDHFHGGRFTPESGYTGAPIEHAYSTVSKHVTYSHQQVTQRPLAPPAPAAMPILELSENTFRDLEILMMEGDLLEVCMDETKRLWHILKACQPGNADSLYELTGISQCSPMELTVGVGTTGTGKVKQRQKRKQDMEQRQELQWHDTDGDEKNIKIKEKKIKLKEKISKTEVVVDGKKKKQKLKQTSVVSVARSGGKKQNYVATESSSSSGNDDDCSAQRCLKPLGKEVNWIQCDKCELWFHYVCVGVKPQDVSADADYVCRQCVD